MKPVPWVFRAIEIAAFVVLVGIFVYVDYMSRPVVDDRSENEAA